MNNSSDLKMFKKKFAFSPSTKKNSQACENNIEKYSDTSICSCCCCFCFWWCFVVVVIFNVVVFVVCLFVCQFVCCSWVVFDILQFFKLVLLISLSFLSFFLVVLIVFVVVSCVYIFFSIAVDDLLFCFLFTRLSFSQNNQRRVSFFAIHLVLNF